jgi:hypothetical protein
MLTSSIKMPLQWLFPPTFAVARDRGDWLLE